MSTSENAAGEIRLSDLISALSVALDLTEGQPMGHAVRSCVLGMRIAEKLKLSQQDRCDLYYALLLKDAGCSTNSARLHQILGARHLDPQCLSALKSQFSGQKAEEIEPLSRAQSAGR